jgi:hypothetical protein
MNDQLCNYYLTLQSGVFIEGLMILIFMGMTSFQKPYLYSLFSSAMIYRITASTPILLKWKRFGIVYTLNPSLPAHNKKAVGFTGKPG